MDDVFGPIARRLVEILDETSRAKVRPLAAVRDARQHFKARAQTLPDKKLLSGLDPAHGAYVSMQHFVALLSEGITALPDLDPLTAPIRAADEEYQPYGPPISPLTESHFFCWALFDAAQGLMRETLGTCLIAAGKHLGMQPEMLVLLRAMQASRLGMYVHEGRDEPRVRLRELFTGNVHRCHVASGYPGRKGELWLVRLFPPPASDLDYDVAFTTPYVILKPGAADWERHLRESLRGTGPDESAAYQRLMKAGTSLSFWNEYIFHAYVRHQDQAIFLAGLPELSKEAGGR